MFNQHFFYRLFHETLTIAGQFTRERRGDDGDATPEAVVCQSGKT